MPIRPEMAGLYPPDWKQISARIRFVRAGYLCECRGECGRDHTDDDKSQAWEGFAAKRNREPELGRCSAVHGQGSLLTGATVVLTVAHLDHNPEHCDDENLKAMCQRCHLAYDADHHAETRRRTREKLLGLVPLEGI